MKALVGAFNQEKALVGAFSVIVQQVVEPMEHYTALVITGRMVVGEDRNKVSNIVRPQLARFRSLCSGVLAREEFSASLHHGEAGYQQDTSPEARRGHINR